jgi:hypothetical protein
LIKNLKFKKSKNSVPKNHNLVLHRRVARGGIGGQIPPLAKKFFNLLGFLRKKIQKIFWFKFFHTKNLKIPPTKNFWLRPWSYNCGSKKSLSFFFAIQLLLDALRSSSTWLYFSHLTNCYCFLYKMRFLLFSQSPSYKLL